MQLISLKAFLEMPEEETLSWVGYGLFDNAQSLLVSFLEEFVGFTFAIDRVIEFKGNAPGISDLIKNSQLFNQWKNPIAW